MFEVSLDFNDLKTIETILKEDKRFAQNSIDYRYNKAGSIHLSDSDRRYVESQKNKVELIDDLLSKINTIKVY